MFLEISLNSFSKKKNGFDRPFFFFFLTGSCERKNGRERKLRAWSEVVSFNLKNKIFPKLRENKLDIREKEIMLLFNVYWDEKFKL